MTHTEASLARHLQNINMMFLCDGLWYKAANCYLFFWMLVSRPARRRRIETARVSIARCRQALLVLPWQTGRRRDNEEQHAYIITIEQQQQQQPLLLNLGHPGATAAQLLFLVSAIGTCCLWFGKRPF